MAHDGTRGTGPDDVDDDAVVAFWRRLDLPGLVDVHVHAMPPNVLAKVWEFFDRAQERIGQAWPIRYREPEPQRVARLRRMGVRRFGALLYPHKAGMAEWLNGWARDFAARTPDTLHSATFFAEAGAAGYLRSALDDGACLVKAHVQVGGYDPTDPLLDDVWALLDETQTPVVLHAGSGPHPGAHTGPGPVAAVLRRHPSLRLVIAHLGGPEYADFLALAERHPHVHLDTTMAFTSFFERLMPFPRELVPRLADLGDRVLLGSDFPNIPYAYVEQLDALAGLGLGDDWLRAVCWHNPVRLLGLD